MTTSTGRRITIGAKARPEIGLGIDRAVLAYPSLFTNRSDFVRIAVARLLTELRLAEQPVNLQSPSRATSEHTEGPRSVNRTETTYGEGVE